MKKLTFSEHFGTDDKEILLVKGGNLIKLVRKMLGLTGSQFQQLLKDRGATDTIDPGKQSKWERGRTIPDSIIQNHIIRIYNEKQFDTVTAVEFGFDLPPIVRSIRNVFFAQMYEDALVFIQRESEVGILSAGKDKIDPNVWPLLTMLESLVHRAIGDNQTALEVIEAPAGNITDQKLRDIYEINRMGMKFPAIENISDPAIRNHEYEKIAKELRLLMQRWPKTYHVWGENLLRVYSRLDDSDRFTALYEELCEKPGTGNIKEIVSNEEDDDFANARKFKILKNKQQGFATVQSSILTFLGASLLALSSIFSTAEATTLKTTVHWGGKFAAEADATFDPMKAAMNSAADATLVNGMYAAAIDPVRVDISASSATFDPIKAAMNSAADATLVNGMYAAAIDPVRVDISASSATFDPIKAVMDAADATSVNGMYAAAIDPNANFDREMYAAVGGWNFGGKLALETLEGGGWNFGGKTNHIFK